MNEKAIEAARHDWPYQRTFDAIAAAIDYKGRIGISVAKFAAAFGPFSRDTDQTMTPAKDAPPLRAREEIARALEPFAKIAADYEASDKQSEQHHRDEGRTWTPRSNGHRVSIALGDCRRAREALSSTAGQEWRVPECVEKALRHAKADIDAAIPYIGRLEGTPYGLLQTQQLLEEAIAALPAPPVAEPIVAERKEPIGFVNIYRHADCHELGGTDIYKTIDQAKTFDASDYDKGYLGIGVVTLLAEQRPETK